MNRREAIRRAASLTGVAISCSIISTIINGCQPVGDPGWTPKFLTSDEYKLVSAIADIILPATDTPGAVDLNVPQVIDLLLADNLAISQQQGFRQGYSSFIEVVKERYDAAFEKASKDEQFKTIEDVEADNGLFSDGIKGSFYSLVKQYTIFSYYTSAYVMENMLDYHPIPGRQEGCIPFDEDGKLFVTN